MNLLSTSLPPFYFSYGVIDFILSKIVVTNLFFLHREPGLSIGIFWSSVKRPNCSVKYNNGIVLISLIDSQKMKSIRL